MIETPTTDYVTLVFGLVPILISSIGTLFVKNWLDKRAVASAATQDLDIRFTITDIQKLSVKIENLIEITRVDRFLLLKAENGQSVSNATAILSNFDQRKLLELYDHVEIDDFYREMLTIAEARGFFAMETRRMPSDSRLRGYYEDEHVVFANCYFLARFVVKGKAVIFYCTAATTQGDKFTARELREIERLIDYLKQTMRREIERILARK